MATVPSWLQWPSVWYATPTFGAFIAMQAPYWKYTDHVIVALLVWLIAGVAVDVWMTRENRRSHSVPQVDRIYRITGSGFIFGLILAFAAVVLHPWTSRPDRTWGLPDAVLQVIALILPGLDFHYRELIKTGRLAYFSYIGSFYLLFAIVWLGQFLLLYLALVRMPTVEFVRAVQKKKSYGHPPYGASQRRMALKGQLVAILFMLFTLLPFSSDVWTFSSHPVTQMMATGVGFIYLAVAPIVASFCLWLFHSARQFRAMLSSDGFLPNAEERSRSP